MKVIVTRPRLEADAWVKQLHDLHLDAVALPLIHIGAPSDNDDVAKAWMNLHQYSAVMFVSSNAVRYFYLSKMPKNGVNNAWTAIKKEANSDKSNLHSRMWATGPGTRNALLAQSVAGDLIDSPFVDAAQFDSEALWNIVKHQVKTGDRVLIVRGSSSNVTDSASVKINGRPWLADKLTVVGVQVDEVVSYQRSAPVFDAAQTALMRQASTDQSVWLLSSSEAVANLQEISAAEGIHWSKARAIATHPRIAQAAREAGFGVVYESRPLLADVVASIESMT